jgi:uncharacterized PurR-regulated membrane protein YhhQ (DUF165 family)
MAAIVVASNILVQFPLGQMADLGGFHLSLRLPCDRPGTNRLQGPSAARKVVVAGFITGLICSLIGTQIQGEFGPLVTLRVAIGSGLAYLNGQILTDISSLTAIAIQVVEGAVLVSTMVGSTL